MEIARVQLRTPNFFNFSVDFFQAVGYSISTMNIELLIANLENTIAGKELYLAGCTNPTARAFVQLNVDELKRILADAKVVQEQVLQLEVTLDGFVHGSL